MIVQAHVLARLSFTSEIELKSTLLSKAKDEKQKERTTYRDDEPRSERLDKSGDLTRCGC